MVEGMGHWKKRGKKERVNIIFLYKGIRAWQGREGNNKCIIGQVLQFNGGRE